MFADYAFCTGESQFSVFALMFTENNIHRKRTKFTYFTSTK